MGKRASPAQNTPAQHSPTPPVAREDLGLEQFELEPDDNGLSLDDLGRAYAELVGGGQVPYESPPSAEDAPAPNPGESDELELPRDEQLAAADESCELSPRSILEAILFVGHPENRPVSSREVAQLMRGVRASEIDEMVQELNAEYAAQKCPYEIRSVESGYRLELRSEFSRLRDKVYGRVRAAKLSQPAVDVLAIVAYNQPITREQVDEIRARPSGAILSQLVRRELLRIDRVVEGGKKGNRFVTTDRFLTLFGLSNLEELPQGQELDRPSEW